MTDAYTAIASRLVNELMLVSVLVAGQGAPALAASLENEGASAAALMEGQAGEGFDLAILLADPATSGRDDTRALVTLLSAASERLLFAPLPLGAAKAGDNPALAELTQWFEVFAEFGYQPVVEFDASFISPGAFLVDRAATAAESELAAFADRLQLGPEAAAAKREPPAAPASRNDAELEALRTRLEAAEGKLAGTEAELATTRAQAAESGAEAAFAIARAAQLADDATAARAEAETLKASNAGWDGLRHWIRQVIGDPRRDTPAALARELPRLNRLRHPAPPVMLPKPALLDRLRPWRIMRSEILADTSLVRASRLFDAAWYVASNPGVAEGQALDPVFHYVLVGSLQGADPGPWFDTAAYLAAHPQIAGRPVCALVHAIRTGADREMATV